MPQKSRKNNRKTKGTGRRRTKKVSRTKSKSQNGGGFTFNLSSMVGGLMERFGYSECNPPVYQNNKMMLESDLQQKGGKRRKSKKVKRKSYNKK